MQQYMEFYYPTTGKFFYQITFDWGNYTIDTEVSLDEEVHKKSVVYKGYITMRPNVNKTPEGEELLIFLITPKGQVWASKDFSIPESKSRQEVVEEKTEYGKSTSTTTINSTSEPIIDNFLNAKESWSKYGELKSNDGKNFTVHLIGKN